MTKLTRWMDLHTDPTGTEHPIDPDDRAMRPLLAAALFTIALTVAFCLVLWFSTRPVGELAPATGTTTTEGAP